MSVQIQNSGDAVYNAVSQSEDSDNGGWQTDECNKMNISWQIKSVEAFPDVWQKTKSCCRAQQPQTILRNVHGIVNGGQMLALMGGSGSGKTTMLNVMHFKQSPNLQVNAEIFINGVKADAAKMAQVSCFVRQNDLFFGNLTVEEHLTIHARLRLSRYTTEFGIRKKVNAILKQFQLEICRSVYIQDISGGQGRRLSFATEILTDPQVLFCDEPTSGLDSHIAKELIKFLRLLANSGKTIICTIHQPSIEVFKIFNLVCLLSSGDQAFFGPLDDAKQYFEKGLELPCPADVNPADHYVECLGLNSADSNSRQAIKTRCNKYKTSNSYHNTANQIKTQPIVAEQVMFRRNVSKSTFFTQFRQLAKRSYLTYTRNTFTIFSEMIMAVFTGMLGGGVFFRSSTKTEDGACIFRQDDIQNISTTLFYSLMTMSLISTLSAVLAFPSEIKIIEREENVYKIAAYYLAKFLVELPIYIIKPAIHALTIYFMVGLGCSFENFMFYLFILILASNAAYALGHLLSAWGGDFQLAITFAAPVLAIQILFSGFFLNQVRHLANFFKALKYLSIFHYGYDVLMINQWKHSNLTCTEPMLCITEGRQVLDNAKIDVDNKWWFIAALSLMVIVYRLLTYVRIKMIVYKEWPPKLQLFKKRVKSPDPNSLIV